MMPAQYPSSHASPGVTWEASLLLRTARQPGITAFALVISADAVPTSARMTLKATSSLCICPSLGKDAPLEIGEPRGQPSRATVLWQSYRSFQHSASAIRQGGLAFP